MAVSSTQLEGFVDPSHSFKIDLSDLPSDIIQAILEKLPLSALKNIAQVSKRMHAEVESYLQHKSLSLTLPEKDALTRQAIDAKFKMMFSIMYRPDIHLTPKHLREAFNLAINDGEMEKVKALSIHHDRGLSNTGINLAIRAAVEKNRIDVVKHLVEKFGFRDMLFPDGYMVYADHVRQDCVSIAKKAGRREIFHYLQALRLPAAPAICTIL